MVYPRVYGGTRPSAGFAPAGMGLSPRVRGNHDALALVMTALGSIPACTGEPRCTRPRYDRPGVYPRVYGGTRVRVDPPTNSYGLSPRVRGNPSDGSPNQLEPGSIPACTGEPGTDRCDCLLPEVYPRVYGGTQLSGGVIDTCVGLSPRVRGNLGQRLDPDRHEGSIPACTGEPSSCTYSARLCRVYPRVYGGTARRYAEARNIEGLSPRVRGNLNVVAEVLAEAGSIPACTGEPSV